MGLNPHWAHQAACQQVDPDTLFVQGAAQNRAKAVCMGCPVRTECLADALDNRVEFGVWGGMTERERRALLRRKPDVTSWWKLLEQARRNYYQPIPRQRIPLEEMVAAAEKDLLMPASATPELTFAEFSVV